MGPSHGRELAWQQIVMHHFHSGSTQALQQFI